MDEEISNLWKKDLAHVWHPYTRFSALRESPLPIIVRGEGPYLFDARGNKYFDAISSWWSCAVGHNHPEIIAAIQAQAEQLDHSILGGLTHPRAIELAAEIVSFFPHQHRHVLFASDGASAVEAALKVALQYAHNRGQTQRTHFAALKNAYHGDTLGAVSVGFLEAFHAPYRMAVQPAITLPIPGNSVSESECRAIAEARLRENSNRLAALIVEPLCLCAAGMRMYPPSYLSFLAELCDRHGLLLICDEIATGFGRTGRWFAFEHAGVDPDIVCLGKSLSAGTLPISATVVKDEIYATFDDRPADHTFYHGHTFCGNPIAAAAALAALRLYRKLDLPACAKKLEAVFSRKLYEVRKLVADVRVLGGIAAIEWDEPTAHHVEAAAKEEALPKAHRVREYLRRKGILVRPLGNVVYLFPPLTISDAEATELAGRLCEAVHEMA